jgi:hypothetical protein
MVRSTWFTGARTRLLLTVLAATPRPAGMPSHEAEQRYWRSCGGRMDDFPIVVQVLMGAELLAENRSMLRLTRLGHNVVAKRNDEGLQALGLALLRAGFFHDQARVLLEIAIVENGNLRCLAREARRRCPQLVGMLQLWPEVMLSSDLYIPRPLVQELETVWALLPPPDPEEAIKDALRKNIGNRGEMYSYQYERQNAGDEAKILWVARDDSNLGYDIEDRSVTPHRKIEVKASGGVPVRFFLSDNEWRKAHEYRVSYEIHFWGGVDLNSDPAEEYTRLCGSGYPLVFCDLPDLLAEGEFNAQPAKWRLVKT